MARQTWIGVGHPGGSAPTVEQSAGPGRPAPGVGDAASPPDRGGAMAVNRTVGDTGLALSVTGLGAWAIGGGEWQGGWGPQDDDESVAAIHHAVEVGVNWIDTAAAYGLGRAESVVGRAVQALPETQR